MRFYFNKIYLLSFVCFFVVSMSSCDFVYRLLDKQGAEEKENLGEITPFVHNERVEEVQKLLKLYGYNVGKADGKFGPHTREAIARFQKNMGLEVSRFVDDATWTELHSFSASELVVDGEINIEAVQKALQLAGFKPGEVDGKMGKKTKNAIIELQRSNELKVDGIIGLQTLRILNEYLIQ